jgi:hypothetical protein
MLPSTGPTTGPTTLPKPQITITVACSVRGNVAKTIAWPIGMISAPNRPCPMRKMTSAARLLASPHKSEHIVKPPTALNMTPRQPSRLASQPVVGVAMAVATRLSVTTQAISS